MNILHRQAGFGLILSYITPHRRVLLMVLGLLVAGSLLTLLNPWMAGLLTASVMGSNEQAMGVRLLLGLWFCIIVVRSLLSFATQYFIGSTGERITAELLRRCERRCAEDDAFRRGVGVVGGAAVGRGDREPAWIGELLAARDRTLADVAAPPEGLYLVGVGYDSRFDVPPAAEPLIPFALAP